MMSRHMKYMNPRNFCVNFALKNVHTTHKFYIKAFKQKPCVPVILIRGRSIYINVEHLVIMTGILLIMNTL